MIETRDWQLSAWLSEQDVTGYARQLLLMERFGYPDFVRRSASELIDQPVRGSAASPSEYEALVKAAAACGPIVIQARKTYVSLVSPRRTFARIQCPVKTRIDLGLRLDSQRPAGRLQPSTIHETMRLKIGLAAVNEVDAEVRQWLRRAYTENA